MIHSFELPAGVAIGGYKSVFPDQDYIRIGDSGYEIQNYNSTNKMLDAKFTFDSYPEREVILKLNNTSGTINDNYDGEPHNLKLENCSWRFFDQSRYFKVPNTEDKKKPIKTYRI
jgi:hypothetical protein